jgi:Carbohydrate family 9 binding domain-like
MKIQSFILVLMALIMLQSLSCHTEKTNKDIQTTAKPFSGLEHLFAQPKNYIAYKTSRPIVVDGDINDDDWIKAEWTNEFVDIEGSLKPNPHFSTRAKMLWDSAYFYFAAELKDPHVWATLENHDDVIYLDNDFEIFIDVNNDGNRPNLKYPDHDTYRYYEFEMNALNTTWDLFLDRAYRNGGLPMTSWDIKELKTGVKVHGTINNPDDMDEGWTLEVAIPFSAIRFATGRDNVPTDGVQYRINFSRVQYDTKIVDRHYVKAKDSTGKDLPCHNWVWSPQGVINMHYPERWGYAQFSEETVGTRKVPFVFYYSEKQKNFLWLVYYKQKEWRQKKSRYAVNWSELGLLGKDLIIEDKKNIFVLEATPNQFIATIKAEGDQTVWSINQDGLIQQSNQELK